MQDFELQLGRLKKALNVESDTAFSQALGMSQGSVSGAKKRGQIPHAWFFQVAEKTNVSLDWLFWGHGLMHLEHGNEAEEQPALTTATVAVEGTLTLSGMQAMIDILKEELAKAKESEKAALIEAKEAYKMAFEAARAEADKAKESVTLGKGDSKNIA